MKLTKTLLITLGIVLLIAGAVTLYMLYRGQVKEQDSLRESVQGVNTSIQLLELQRVAVEKEMAQLESDIAQAEGETGQLEAEIAQKQAELAQLEDEREQAVARAQELLEAMVAKFVSSAESIEYNEKLFGFARDAGLAVGALDASEPAGEGVDGVDYTTTTFSISVKGEVDQILNFVKTVVADEAFKTAVVETFVMVMPEPLTDGEKANLEENIRSGLTNRAIAEITTEEMVGFITAAIAEVTGPESDWPDEVETQTVAEMAQVIEEKIDAMVEAGYIDSLADDLAELIEERIEGAVVDKIIKPLAEQIAAMIVEEDKEGGFSQDDLEELLGEDIAKEYPEGLGLGDSIASSLAGEISGLLKEYIANLVDAKVMASVAAEVELAAQQMAAEQVTEMEMPYSEVGLVIYTYEGE